MRKIKRYQRKDGATCTVWYDYEFGEYQCLITWNGVPHEPSRYHTDDKEDALLTAQMMLHRFQPSIWGVSQSSRGGTILSQIDPNQPIWGTK